MKKSYLFAAAALALAGCADGDYVGKDPEGIVNKNDAILFQSKSAAMTRADYVGATAADFLGNNFIVEGTKGTEAADAPTSTVVFDNYKVEYTANTAGTTESNTHNWEYVGLSKFDLSGITGNQSIKYWDYSVPQYDFVAYSTGKSKMITTGDPTTGEVLVTAINATNKGYTFTGAVADLKNCYITDIKEVKLEDGGYNNVVTLKFKNLTSKVRMAIYETIPGYSVKNVQFYTDEATKINVDLSADTYKNATLFTTGTDVIPQNGTVTVSYPIVGNDNDQKEAYNKASVAVEAATGTGNTTTGLTYGSLNYVAGDNVLSTTNYLGRTLPTATFAGEAKDNYYQAVLPNNEGKPLTLRVNYTLESNDGSNETITVYGAKAVVPATYTAWQPNYAYTYIFKISDNTNGWTANTVDGNGDPTVTAGLHPITFDAVVAEVIDANAEQTTITTVAAPSITTYQQGHTYQTNEYSKSQTAGKSTDVKKVYVQVMNNSGATPSLVTTLSADNALLFELDDDHTEALVMDALQFRKSATLTDNHINGRNKVVLTKNTNIDATVTKIQNGANDEEIDLTTAGKAAAIDIKELTSGKSYAFVYVQTDPTAGNTEAIYQPIAVTVGTTDVTGFYKVAAPASDATALAADSKAVAGKVYFCKNTDAVGGSVKWTFVQTRVNDDVAGLYEGTIPTNAETSGTAEAGNFYFDVYYKNDGKYAVKVVKVVD